MEKLNIDKSIGINTFTQHMQHAYKHYKFTHKFAQKKTQ